MSELDCMLFSRPPAHKLAGVGALRRLNRLHPSSRAAPLSRSLQSSTDREQNVDISRSNPVELSEPAKPFEAIPTTKRIPLLGISRDIWKILPNDIRFVPQRLKELGKIFREKSVPGVPEFLYVIDPDDIAKVYRADGKQPRRIPFDDLIKVKKELNVPLAIFHENGDKWERIRKPVSKFMMVPRKVSEYHETFNEITLDLLEAIGREKGEEDMLLDVQSLMHRWAFESVSNFVFGKRLGSLQKEIPSDCKMFINELHTFFDVTQKLLFSFPFHKLWATKNWKTFINSQVAIYDIALRHINEKVANVTDEKKRVLEEVEDEEPPVGVDFITFMLHSGKMDVDTIANNSVELMIAGVDTSSSAVAWALYCLANNPEVQEKLRSEILAVAGSDKLVTPEHIARMPYLRDCIRETLRLYPIGGIANTRILSEDVVLSGYQVPAGTCISMPMKAAGTIEEYFPEPEKFKPERWSRENRDTAHMFGSLPFGFGVRMCVGRRVAELQIHIAVAQLMKNFRVEYRDDHPVGYVQQILIYPDRRMDLAFIALK